MIGLKLGPGQAVAFSSSNSAASRAPSAEWISAVRTRSRWASLETVIARDMTTMDSATPMMATPTAATRALPLSPPSPSRRLNRFMRLNSAARAPFSVRARDVAAGGRGIAERRVAPGHDGRDGRRLGAGRGVGLEQSQGDAHELRLGLAYVRVVHEERGPRLAGGRGGVDRVRDDDVVGDHGPVGVVGRVRGLPRAELEVVEAVAVVVDDAPLDALVVAVLLRVDAQGEVRCHP